ncbi:MAG TPA: hypothetical protein VFX25_32640 [Streptosporangiaceae bacterium]|nr:hypothetical protein [Streptosporangiaceae bacterium]
MTSAGLLVAVAFAAVAALLCVAAALAVLGTAQVQLSGPAAIEHDGLAPGRAAPRWSLPDAAGVQRQSPPAAPLQLVIFADHSLKSFPSVLSGLRDLLASEPGLEAVILLRGRNELAAPLLSLLGLDVPVVTGSPGLYARYNVRVGPFAIVVDSAGQVRASSLVNHDWQIAKLHQLASIAVEFPRRSTDRRLRRAAIGAV